MAEQSNHKRVTRADALVGGMICLLLIVLVPVLLAKPREQSVRRLCAMNLAQIGKLMLLYANDYEGALPRAGGPATMWGPVANWMATNPYLAFGLDAGGGGGTAPISSCFYLLVKYHEASPKLFICRGDKGTTEFKLSNLAIAPPTRFELSDAWDFGPVTEAYRHCSYSYHIPFGQYPLTTSGDPNLAVVADRNPFLNSPMGHATSLVEFRPDLEWYGGTAATARIGNTLAHSRDGENVLFLDGCVTFEKRSYCGVGNDNIYLVSRNANGGDSYGTVPTAPIVNPAGTSDSVLVHDPDVWAYGTKPQKP